MDLGTIGPILIGALASLAAIGQFLRRQARVDRAENRKLRRLVLAYDGHTFRLERDIARLGRTPRRRPAILLEAEQHDEDQDDEAGPDEAGAAEGDPSVGVPAGRRSRHRTEG